MKISNYSGTRPIRAKMLFGGLLLLAAMISFIAACSQKEDLRLEPLTSNSRTSLRTSYFENPPSLEGDRYAFDDLEHFAAYYLELDTLYYSDTDALDSLMELEDRIGSIYYQILTDTFSDPEEAYETWLIDPIMQTVVNDYYEFQIGDVLVTYMNNEEILVSEASDESTQDTIRGMSRGVSIDVDAIPVAAFWSDDEELEEALGLTCGCKISIEQKDCSTVRVYGKCGGFLWSKGQGEVSVWWNGFCSTTGTPNLTEVVRGNFEILIDMSLMSTPIYVIARVDPDCITANNKSTICLKYEDDGTACDGNERELEVDITSTNGQEMMRTNTSFYLNWANVAMHKADIRSFAWDASDQAFHRSRAELDVTIDANQKSLDCTLYDSKDDSKHCNNCKHKAVRVSWWAAFHCDGDVVGEYRKEKSSIVLETEQSIDFECCE